MPFENPWKPFVVPHKFLDSTWNESSPIMRLPTEILIEIFDHADHLDQLALALSCKHLLQVSTFVALKPLPAAENPRCAMEQLLKLIKPLDAAGRPKKTWHICVDCMRYRPTRKGYWKAKRAAEWDKEVWDATVASWNDKYLLQCPECWFQGKLHPVESTIFERYFSLEGS